jgi:hypothetical protein
LSRFTDPASFYTLEIAGRAWLTSRFRPSETSGPTDLFLCVVDHFEPQHGRPPQSVARARLEDWLRRYPEIAAHRDCEGRPPAHGFFYPWDEYDEGEFERLAGLCAEGWGEIDLHLHHRDDTPDTLRRKLREAIQTYSGFGALSRWPDERPAWGFIHGDWALNNSRSDRGRNWCGVNNEIEVLQSEGCYADFTFPAWRHLSQPRQVNSIYFATGADDRPKGHDRGTPAEAGKPPGEGLLLIQGPLSPYLRRKGGQIRPGVDDGDLAATRRYSPERLDRWVRTGIHVKGRPDRIFIKLHSHGAPDANRETLLGTDLNALFTDAETRYNDGQRYRLHYVSPREMFNVVMATIEGVEDLTAARDHLLPPPAHRLTCKPNH